MINIAIRWIVSIYIGINLSYSPAYANEAADIKAENDMAAIWSSNCKKCHQLNGDPTTVGTKLNAPENIFAFAKEKTDEELATILLHGKNKMPSFVNKLSKEELAMISRFIKINILIRNFQENVKKDLNRMNQSIIGL
tara:strand:- start:288 stop:701 length:414 start_codon:yes stop_codon:yes gene_type:complete